jgi:hypothetical protein
MLSRAVNGYSAELIDAVLAGHYGPFQTRIRADLLDKDGQVLRAIRNILVDGGYVNIDANAPATRGGECLIRQADASIASYTALIASLAGLVHWRLGEASGNFDDLTGNGRTLTATATLNYSRPSLLAGETGNFAIQPNGTTGFGSIAHAAWMNVTTQASWYGWIKGTGTTQAFLNRDDGGANRAWSIEVDASGNLAITIHFTSGSPAFKTFTASGAINDGNAHFVAITYDGAHVKIFIDGTRYLKTAETRTISAPTSAVRLGATTAGTKFTNYTLDEWGMVGRAISQGEILDIYQRGTGDLTEFNYRNAFIQFYYAYLMPTAGTDGTYWAEFPLGRMIGSSFERDHHETGNTWRLLIQDQARTLLNKKFSRRWSMGSGINPITGTNGVLAILADAGFDTSTWVVGSTSHITPYEVEVADVDDVYLTVINDILDSYGFLPLWFKADGKGVIELKQFDSLRTIDETMATDSNTHVLSEGVKERTEESEIFNDVILTVENPDGSIIRTHQQNTKVESPYNVSVYELKSYRATVEAANQTELDNMGKHTVNRFAQPLHLLDWPTVPKVMYEPRDKKHLTHTIIKHALNIDVDFILRESRIPFDGGPQANIYSEVQDVVV